MSAHTVAELMANSPFPAKLRLGLELAAVPLKLKPRSQCGTQDCLSNKTYAFVQEGRCDGTRLTKYCCPIFAA